MGLQINVGDTDAGVVGESGRWMDLMLALLCDWIEVTAVAGRLDRDVETEDVSMTVVQFAQRTLRMRHHRTLAAVKAA